MDVSNKDFKSFVEQQRATQEVIARSIIDTELTDLIINIYTFTDTYKEYQEHLQEYFYDLIKKGFEFKFYREHPIHFRFEEGGYIHTMQLRHFVSNLFMWGGIVRIEDAELDAKHIVDMTQINTKVIKSFVDDFIIVPYRGNVAQWKLNEIVHDVVYNLSRISKDFNEILAISMSVETFMDLADRYEQFDQIMHTRLSDDMQPKEIEDLLEKLTKTQMDIIRYDDKYNHLKPIMRSSGAIKAGQFKEFAVNAGLKPDLTGTTIPIPVNNNFITGGLDTVSSYFIDSLAGRKSLIMNKTVMGSSGYFARLIMLVTSDVVLRKDDEVCDSVHPIPMVLRDKEHVSKLKHRYYKLPHERKYKVMRGNEYELVGEMVMLKSPITCASEEGICRQCYGELFDINKTLNSAGGLSATRISEPVTQNILSSKHLLATDSESINFENPHFDDFFNIFANEIMIDYESDAIVGAVLRLYAEDVRTVDQYNSDFDAYVKTFYIKTESGKIHEFSEASSKELFLSPDVSKRVLKEIEKARRKSLWDNDEETRTPIDIKLGTIDSDSSLFAVEINNNELTKPLYDIMDLLNNKKERAEAGIVTIEDAAQRLLDLLIISEIPADSIHGEMIIRSLVRSASNNLKLPNFTRYDALADTQLMTILSALTNHPSITVSLSFQSLISQLENPTTYTKTSTSYLDPFFKKTL